MLTYNQNKNFQNQNQLAVVPKQNYLVTTPEETESETIQQEQHPSTSDTNTSYFARKIKNEPTNDSDCESIIGLYCLEKQSLMANKIKKINDNKENLLLPITVNGMINSQKQKFILDTGSNINIITPKMCKILNISITNHVETIKTIGTQTKTTHICNTKVIIGEIDTELEFFVCEHPHDMILLSRSAIFEFNLHIGAGHQNKNEIIIYQKSIKQNPQKTAMKEETKKIIGKTESIKETIKEFNQASAKNEDDIDKIKEKKACINFKNETTTTRQANSYSEKDQSEIDQEKSKLLEIDGTKDPQ
ncbi:hypothetical protein HUG17_7150 [Dermatophagoides farinae]|uniref:Uncharacterized protein n=1 Tax=Dermatophagoides farinae TaxID=6954 RepID=A0A9D4NR73_DERFA|nr:hypothetical protein HUG17_7150 [Dermatophagoides farinae]